MLDTPRRTPMDDCADTPDLDRKSRPSGGQSPAGAAVKETLGMLRSSLRRSLQGAAGGGPLSPGGKGSKVTTREGATSSETGSPKPNASRFGDSLRQKVVSGRRSLKLITKAMKRSSGEEGRSSIPEDLLEERVEEVEPEEEEEEEMEEAYTLPEIPHIPLSVMQINRLIEMEVLEEAHLHLLALRREFQEESGRGEEASPVELANKEKDLSLLYGDLRSKMAAIVSASSARPSRNKGLLVLVVRIIQEEERRAAEPGGLPGSWMESWRGAVEEGVRAKVGGVHLEPRESHASWLAVHLGLLGKAVVEDLENVRRELRWSYPPSFKVFSTYVHAHHREVGRHLVELEPHVTELKDLHALLDWIAHRYQSERIMGNPSLQPDMGGESRELQLEDDFLKKLEEKYCQRVEEDIRASLDRVTELQVMEVWLKGRGPELEEGVLTSEVAMDVWTRVKGMGVNARTISPQLEQKVIGSCLQEVTQLPKRFETAFRHHCSTLRPRPLWTEYHITYINSFATLQQHMEGYRGACPDQVEALRQEVHRLIVRLMQDLEDQFKEDVEPYLRRMMTRKWLTSDRDFQQLQSRTELLERHVSLLRPPHHQEFASRLHFHVARGYFSQLMKNNYSCKNSKHERAAAKIRRQWSGLRELFQDMKSTHEWLHPVGDDLSDIIGQKNKADIKNHLQPLVEHYPDFSKKHLVAVLSFRGLLRGREHQLILQRLSELKKKTGGAADNSNILFGAMQVAVNTECLSNLPFSCLSFLLPDS
ncbi:exocyst complex component 3-like protein 4 [Antennarius striatus]|uniref:exocyst complex component 3-like protein 4 n=1 Tax=Antennarius striatus TaxID=241820 RepID=UPI0035B152A6